ncbi:MAG: porin [Planctomycetes bacterium]|nr:porin [Planctomycetota bacterium]
MMHKDSEDVLMRRLSVLLSVSLAVLLGTHVSGYCQDDHGSRCETARRQTESSMQPFSRTRGEARKQALSTERSRSSGLSVEEELRALRSRVEQLELLSSSSAQPHGSVPASTDSVSEPIRRASYEESGEPSGLLPRFYVDYDKGFVLRPYDKEATPFELKTRMRMQFRYVGLQRDRKFWTDNAGVTHVISPRNDFEIERGRLEFSGFFFDPNLEYYINIDADTDDQHRAIFHDFWINYVFTDALTVYIGKAFVPGSRSWLDGSTRTHLADRSMATTFFRPDRSIGIWAIGEPIEDFHYRFMVGNGYNTTDLKPSQVDEQFVYSGSIWWEPLGSFGKGYADLEHREAPVVRIGTSFSYGSEKPQDTGDSFAEEKFARLSDGTRLIDSGALAPGVTVNSFDIYVWAIDAALKYQGWSANAEYYFRWLTDFGATGGAIPHTQLYTDGFYVDVGKMIVPHHLELVGRISLVDGFYGDSWEYAAGVNWYINGKHSNKLTFDIAILDGSPTRNSGPNFEAGMDGVLYRLQWQIAAY